MSQCYYNTTAKKYQGLSTISRLPQKNPQKHIPNHSLCGGFFRGPPYPFDSRLPLSKKTCSRRSFWQGRRDSNTQQTVLETVALPLNYSPISAFIITHFRPHVNTFVRDFAKYLPRVISPIFAGFASPCCEVHRAFRRFPQQYISLFPRRKDLFARAFSPRSRPRKARRGGRRR